MVEILQSARPGVLVAYLCLGLGLVLILVALRDWSVRREQRARRREVLEKVMVNNAAPTAAEVDVVWGDALKNLESLQHQLKGDIEGLEHKLEVEREQVQAKTDALKNLARQNRVPITLYELYEGMRHFARKSPEAQKADLEWHGKVGIQQIDVVETADVPPGHEIYFTLDEQTYLLTGAHHRYSRLSYIELSLYDSSDAALITVRVRPDSVGQRLIADAVISMRSGPWIQTLLACRAKMDTRHAEVSLLADHRDVMQLKEKFSIEIDTADDAGREQSTNSSSTEKP